nr:MAG TPA: hypothetical protein [Caudoviricetes sp.]
MTKIIIGVSPFIYVSKYIVNKIGNMIKLSYHK